MCLDPTGSTLSTVCGVSFLRGWWVEMGSVGRMGMVGMREHHLTAWLCGAQGSVNAL